MITLSVSRVPEGARDYEVVALMDIDDDGFYSVQDPDSFLPLAFPVPVTEGAEKRDDQDEGLAFVTAAEDPTLWARNLKNYLRTGYLVPRLHEDQASTPRLGDHVIGPATPKD